MDYTIKISNPYFQDLVYPDFLGKLVIVEKAYGMLPVFSMVFEDLDKDKMRTLNELTPLNIHYTIGAEEFSTEWIIKIANISENAQGFSAGIGGYLNKFGYYKNNKTKYVSGTSQEAMKQIASPYFTFKDDAPSPQDSMNWLSFGKPDKRFMSAVWKHSFIPGDLTLIGINSKAEFIRTSLLTRLSQGTKVLFSNTDTKKGTTYQYASPLSSSLEGTTYFGYSSVRSILNELTGEIEEAQFAPEVIMTPSSKLNQSPDIDKVQYTPLYQNSNTHSNYQKSRNNNFLTLNNISTNHVEIGIQGTSSLQLTDLLYLDTGISISERKTFDGLYLTTGKTQIFSGSGNLTTVYTGTREVSEEIK